MPTAPVLPKAAKEDLSSMLLLLLGNMQLALRGLVLGFDVAAVSTLRQALLFNAGILERVSAEGNLPLLREMNHVHSLLLRASELHGARTQLAAKLLDVAVAIVDAETLVGDGVLSGDFSGLLEAISSSYLTLPDKG